MPTDTRPRLIVVSGPPGSGKTTLAHALGQELRCPVICRDAIREGLVGSSGVPSAGADRELASRANDAFFAVTELLVERGVAAVIEAAFQHGRWAPRLEPLLDRASVRVIRCGVDADRWRTRIAERLDADPSGRAAHADAQLLARIDRGVVSLATWQPLQLGVPTLAVDTSDGYAPPLDVVVAFARS